MNLHQEFQPYIGLRPFTEQEKDLFFGRDRETSILLDKIRANRLTLLLAASGVGKSSLLQAGIMPVLRADGNTELIYHRDWAAAPGKSLKQAVIQHYAEQHNLAELSDKLAKCSLKDTLLACTIFSSGQQIVLLDQFEEFFNYQRFKPEFFPFIEELSAAVLDSSLPAAFVFSMREDFALELNAFKPFLPPVFDSYFRLEKLTRTQARQAIEEPLKKTDWCFELKQDGKEALLEQVLHDLAKREQERQFGVQELLELKELPLLVEPPHLQIVCRELWGNHRDDERRQITWAAYEKAGGAAGILEHYFRDKISLFSRKEQVLASAAFDHLIGQRSTKVAHPLERLAELTRADANLLKSVLDKLQDCAVLRRQKRGEVFWYELYHDIFSESIDKWNREFKNRQRVKRLAVGTSAVLLAGGVLFAGNNWRENYYGRYLQLSQQADISNQIEVYQGTLTGWDIFGQRHFLYETPFLRQDLEADRLFYKTAIKEKADAQKEFTSNLPISDRFYSYMKNGFYQTGHQLAECITHTNDSARITKQIGQFSLVRSNKIAQRLVSLLDQGNSVEAQQAAIPVVATLHINEAVPKIRELLEGKNSDIPAAALKALADIGDKKIISDFIILLKHLSKDDWSMQSAVDQVVRVLRPNEAIPEIKKLILDQNPDTRAAAIKMLAALRADEAIPEINALLKDNDSYVRENSIQFLESLRNKEAIPEFRKLMLDKEPYAQAAAIKALGTLHDKEAVPEIRKLIIDRNANVRSAAIKFLAILGDKEKLSVIKKFILDRDWDVKTATFEYLAELHINEATIDIKKIIENKDSWMVGGALTALTMLHDLEVVPEIRKLIYSRRTSPGALEALATFRDEEAVPAIRTLLHWNDSWMKRVAIKALATLHDSESIPEIRKLMLAVYPSVQAAAVEALGALHDKEAIAEIRRFLDSGEPDVQMAAVKVLGMLHDSRAVPAIRSLIGKGDWKVQEAAIRALGELHDIASISAISKGLTDRYPDIQLAAAQALARLNHSSPQLLAWQQKQLDTAQEKAASAYPDERTEAAKTLASIFTQQSVELLGKLMDDVEQSVAMPAVDSLGIIGEYAPGLVQQQIPKLLALTNHDHLDMQEAAVNALGRIVSFRGKEKAADFPEADQKIRSTFRAFILDQEPKNSFRRIVAIDALGATGRQECAQDFARLLKELKKDDSHYYRCLYWMKRLETDDLAGGALKENLQMELDELAAEKETWRQKRDEQHGLPATDGAFITLTEQNKNISEMWRMEQMEHLLGNALARIDSEKTGIKLLYHPLDQVRQGAIRALAAKADATLIDKIIQAHQNFDPTDLPSPFPYAAFQAIDLALWNLEYTGTVDDLQKLKGIKLESCKIPGQEGAIEERLEWTIARLGERLAKNADTAAAK